MNKAKVDLRERTKDFALSVVRMFSALPKTTEAQILGKQVLRSGTSIGANYREAYRGRSRAEFIAKCGDCLREIEETAEALHVVMRLDELIVQSGVGDRGEVKDRVKLLIAELLLPIERSQVLGDEIPLIAGEVFEIA